MPVTRTTTRAGAKLLPRIDDPEAIGTARAPTQSAAVAAACDGIDEASAGIRAAAAALEAMTVRKPARKPVRAKVAKEQKPRAPTLAEIQKANETRERRKKREEQKRLKEQLEEAQKKYEAWRAKNKEDAKARLTATMAGWEADRKKKQERMELRRQWLEEARELAERTRAEELRDVAASALLQLGYRVAESSDWAEEGQGLSGLEERAGEALVAMRREDEAAAALVEMAGVEDVPDLVSDRESTISVEETRREVTPLQGRLALARPSGMPYIGSMADIGSDEEEEMEEVVSDDLPSTLQPQCDGCRKEVEEGLLSFQKAFPCSLCASLRN